MLVKFLKQTRHNLATVMPGDTADVPTDTANRWAKAGIAKPVGGDTAKAPQRDTPIDPQDIPLKGRTNAVLADMLEELGGRLPHKVTKANLISAINNARKRAEGGGDNES